ncbi:Gfo/Idh/MocA family oxidoreductase [Micromonospora sp. DT227]|uniref:Gfo/Idh/MocA family oxidoreductase n=1 Tax=Micromonospora sp. DT227 TaxID=3393433 RepID=UPI003CF4E4F1
MTVRREAPPVVGVVGAGRIGAVHVGNLIRLGARVCVAEPDPRRRAVVEREFGCPTVSDPADLPDVAGVVVATPTRTHVDVVRATLTRRVPILLEKPCAADPVLSAELGTAADRVGVPLRIGFQRRQAPEFVALRRAMTDRCGTVGFAAFTSLDGTPPPAGYQVAGGSLAYDLQIHDIDLVRWLFDSPVVEVSAVQADRRGAVDLLVTTLRLASGTVCSLVGKRISGAGCEVWAHLVGDVSSIDTRQLHEPRTHIDFRSRFAEAYEREAASFLRLVRGGADTLPDWRDAVAAEDVCQRVEKSLTAAVLEPQHG